MTTCRTYWPLFFFIASIILSLWMHIPLYITFACVFLIMALYSHSKGRSFEQIYHRVIQGTQSVSNVILLLSFIMMLIPLWMLIGTIPTLLAVGFETLQHQNLMVVAFILSAILSMTIGTAMGTMSILISSFIALATSASIPLPMIVGAIVSGAYIGDRSALMSGSVHLNASITNTNASENFNYMFRTLGPGLLIGFAFYMMIGLQYPITPETVEHFRLSATLLKSQFVISWFVMTPIALMLVLLIFAKCNMRLTLLITIAYSFCLLLFQKISLLAGLSASLTGSSAVLDNGLKLTSNGFKGVLPILGVILFSTLINELFDELNLIKPLLDKYISNTKQFIPLSFKVGILTLLISIITCSQTLMIVICGQHLKPYYDKLNYSRKDLMLTIADYGIITVPLIAWNVNGQLIEALSGVPTAQYFQFTIICLIMPLMNLFYSLLRNRRYTVK